MSSSFSNVHALQALVLLALLGAAWEFRNMMLAASSNGWRKTRGTVLEAWFDETWVTNDDDDNRTEHRANVRYRYRVGARDYESTRLSYQPTRGAYFSDVVGLLKGVYKGHEVDVYYDPRNPARAVLQPGGSLDNVLRVLAPLALASWFGYLLVNGKNPF